MSAGIPSLSRFQFLFLVIALVVIFLLYLSPRCAHAKSLATMVLVDIYDNQSIPGLPKVESDQAGEVAQALTAADYEVIRLVNPTKAEVENLFFQTLPVKLARGDTLVVYFAGRGVGGDYNDPYLLPRNTNPDDIEGSGVKVEGLLGSVSQAMVIVLSNTTQSGGFGKIAFIGPQSRHWADQIPASFVLSVMPLGDDVVWSDFGKVVTNGLGHSADVSNDGNITLAEFRRYLESQIGSVTSDRVRVDVAGNYDPTMVVSTAPRFIPLPEPSIVVTRKGHRVLGWSLLGSGATLGAGSAVLYAVGQNKLNDLNPENSSSYETVRSLQIGTSIAGGTLAAAGAGLLIIRF